MCDNLVKPLYYEWSKSYKAPNTDHFQSHRYLNVKKFVPSYDAVTRVNILNIRNRLNATSFHKALRPHGQHALSACVAICTNLAL